MKRLNGKNRNRSHLLGAATMAAIVGLAASACADSEPEREYKVPSALCGTPISADLLEPALPPGKEISLRVNKSSGYQRCSASVDDTQVLSAITSWWPKGTTVTKVAAGQPFEKLDNVITEDGRYAYSENGGVGKVDCPNPTMEHRKDYELIVEFRSNNEAKESEMKNLVTGLTKSVAESDECTSGKS